MDRSLTSGSRSNIRGPMIASEPTHRTTWARASAPCASTLPAIKPSGDTEVRMISTIRFSFSSETLSRSSPPPNRIATVITIAKA